jgi:hypothetical protein
MKRHRVSGGIAPRILNLGTKIELYTAAILLRGKEPSVPIA